MTDRSGDSYCGIYCGACDIRLAGDTGQKTRLAAFWNEPTIRAFLKAQGLASPDASALTLRCGGCKSDDRFVNCKGCKLRACARGRNLDHCSACADYPCPLYRGWQRASTVLPHVELAPGSLHAVELAGLDRWLSEQDERWRCPDCAARIGWYSETCPGCGRDVTDRTFRLSPVKAVLLRLALTLARPPSASPP
jgi:hypothetical protein